MKLPRRNFLHLAAAAAALPAVSRIAWAQNYPTRPVKIVVPAGPSGSYDIVGRALADQLAKRLDQTVVVENRAGAGTVVGTQAPFLADLVAFSHLQFSQIRGHQPYLNVRKILYVIHPDRIRAKRDESAERTASVSIIRGRSVRRGWTINRSMLR